jgi:lysozyme family protein
MSNFDRALALVVGVEGDFSNDPTDPGNWTGGKCGVGVLKGTKRGISAAQYPNLDIENLTDEQIGSIYEADYWNACQCDALPWPLALLVFDCAVNQGQPTARVTLQHALGVAADGVIGPATLTAAQHSSVYHAARFMALRGLRYTQSSLFTRDGEGWFVRLFTVALSQGA